MRKKKKEIASEVIGQFRVTPAEKALLKRAAKAVNRTVTGYVKNTALLGAQGRLEVVESD